MTADEATAVPDSWLWGVAGPAHWVEVQLARHRGWPAGTAAGISPRTFPTREAAQDWAIRQVVPSLGSAYVAEFQHGVVVERARYEQRVPDSEFASLPSGFGPPVAWRGYLQQPAWFAKGWLPTGSFVWLYSPGEALELTRGWVDERTDLPGVLIIGSDGGGDHLVLDVAQADSPVYALPNVCVGWEEAILQSPTMAAFTAAVNDGSFDWRLE